MNDIILPVFGPDHPLYGMSVVFVFIIGSCVGSFLNVVVWRVPRGESIVTGPSHCPKCNYLIRPWENIPILGWLMLRGKCSNCGTSISARYPTVEFMTAILMVSAWMRGFGQDKPIPMIAGWLVLMALLVAIIYIDIDHMIIPDSINLFGLLVALVLAVGWPGSHDLANVANSLGDLRHRSLLLSPAVELLMRIWEPVLYHPRLLALLDALLGVLFGGGVLWLLVEGGKLLLGRRKVNLEEPVTMSLDHEHFQFQAAGDDEPEGEPWEDVFLRERDRFVVTGTVTACTLRGAGEVPAIDQEKEIVVTVSDEQVQVGDHAFPLAELSSMTIRTRQWVEPREAMGLGDVKMLAMLGAFVGPGGALFILAVSSLLGSIGGVASILFSKGKLHSKIPYGPYIALAAILYILFDRELIALYVRLIYRFMEFTG